MVQLSAQTVLNISLLKSVTPSVSWKTEIPTHLDDHIQLGILSGMLKLGLSPACGKHSEKGYKCDMFSLLGPR